MTPQTNAHHVTRNLLLICGIVASLLYVGATILGAMQWKGYDWTSREVSELFALDAPSRPIVAPAFLAYGVLMLAFGWGVFLSTGSKRVLRLMGILLMGYAVIGEPGPLFFAMHTMVRGGGVQGMQPSDILHASITVVLVLLILLILGLGATVFGLWFRLYSIGTLLLVLVFGALAGVQSGQLATNQPTPWMGVEERINIFGFMLWIVVLSLLLLRAQGSPAQHPESRSTRMSEVTSEDVVHLLQKGARDFAGRNLAGISLPRANLRGADLSGANLRGANLSWDDLRRANLSRANLEKTDLSKADLRAATLVGANLSGVDLHWANLHGLDLRGLDLSFANLSGANLGKVNLSGANLSGANLSKVDLRATTLGGANLSGADLQWANLRGLDLRGVDLSNADLRHANLQQAILPEAALNQAR